VSPAAPGRVALVTSERGRPIDPDLPLLVDALGAEGVTADVVRWDDASADWDAYRLSVIRSTWDYAWRLPEFLAWAGRVPRLRNAADVVRWNTDKTYLRDLERAGLPVVPTVWNPAAEADLPEATEWVVKPSVSAGSRDTARWSDADDALAHVAALVAAGRTAMVQPYLRSVDAVGETALLFLGGHFSHAVRKGPLLAAGEGIRQDRDSRGDLRAAEGTAEQLRVAREVHDALPALVAGAADLLYARIDLVADASGRIAVLEVELTEPSLFLPQAPGAAARLARAIAAQTG
jgi:hypothetical protein